MNSHEFETRIIEWARRRSDVEALILAGSRALDIGADELSDWDFHLITTEPQRYYQTEWLNEIAPLWCANAELTPRGIIKVSAVFENGLEADFVPLPIWQMKLIYWSMRHPEWSNWMPARLYHGILETRQLIVGPGYKVILGESAWESRLVALSVVWPRPVFSYDDLLYHAAAFWRHAVWVQKKCSRGESRAALRWQHLELSDHVYALLAEEARLAGRPARPEARKAEKWLDAKRLEQTSIETGTDQRVLARALLSEIALFEELCQSVAGSRGWTAPDYSAVAVWLRKELTKLLDQV